MEEMKIETSDIDRTPAVFQGYGFDPPSPEVDARIATYRAARGAGEASVPGLCAARARLQPDDHRPGPRGRRGPVAVGEGVSCCSWRADVWGAGCG